MILDIASVLLIGAGCVFFTAGTIGLLRFPDLRTRVHALAKADNLGLGLIVLGLIVQSDSVATALKLVVIWFLALAAAGTSAFLLARRNTGEEPAQ
ncbi:monovalent cation/H(+) antiporter subunit G [Hoyosella sp. YIM 151337]|uniref:cation:proton antiporter n=1 Tax=Hoyosella sp. YIM 151337 TaxID=2992742 RepID=UPI0022361DF4|nr:monovalent cation/H(+) antiporter subunit G [Hoyosella sp. YIM 151337]MCW4353968.1 monovalent cation/H(+) antiporter subunit G [Hoyosella sp. YIM 151337]